MVTVNHQDLGVAIWLNGMICKTDFVAFSGRIDDVIRVQVEQERTHVLVVDLAASIRFVLRDNLQRTPEELILIDN